MSEPFQYLPVYNPGNEPVYASQPVDPTFTGPMKKITVTICGDGGTGKSCITVRLVRSTWRHEYDPTIEDSYTITRNVEGIDYTIVIIDTAGQEEYRGLWEYLHRDSEAFLMVYDITNPKSFQELEDFNSKIDTMYEQREEAKHETEQHGKDAPPLVPPIKIVVGNKCDLQQNRKVDAQEGLRWARAHGCGFMETSARNKVNINETLNLLIKRVAEARNREPELVEPTHMFPDQLLLPNPALTQHAVTAPLSPLPPASSHEEDASEEVKGKELIKGRWINFFERLKCWRC